MKGKILHIDDASGEGVISTEDGARYRFSAPDLMGAGEIARAGAAVDFAVAGDRAVEVYPDPGPAHVAVRRGDKNKIVAALLAFFLGAFGVHKFYIGANLAGVIMLVSSGLGFLLFFLPNAVMGLISFIEGIIYLTRSDEQFYETYEVGRKAWF
ncbi:TM2 domain-containing protein [uncultured Paracoccus sp.]|uniref:TM2 domain-containing protein n=1 Tax=uncultured Paracoccus sp. TaxID=189685 RepID=UPI00262AE368|nr:TM2 domain-containing protein [uncultured Paracoccus sp.]